MTEEHAAPQQPNYPAAPPPPSGPPAYYAQHPYGQQPPRKSKKGLIIGIVVGVSAAMIVILAVLAAIAIPVFLDQRGKANDAAAKADASSLGALVATYYVYNDGPAPDVEVIDGYYVVDGEKSRYPASASVEFGGIEGTGWEDWCVWVSAPEGTEKDFNYSAINGLRVGTC